MPENQVPANPNQVPPNPNQVPGNPNQVPANPNQIPGAPGTFIAPPPGVNPRPVFVPGQNNTPSRGTVGAVTNPPSINPQFPMTNRPAPVTNNGPFPHPDLRVQANQR